MQYLCKYTKFWWTLDKYWNKYYYRPIKVLNQVQKEGIMIVYSRSHRRRPVRIYLRWGRSDEQAEIPWFWCCRCGKEVFKRGAFLCGVCQKEDEHGKDIL